MLSNSSDVVVKFAPHADTDDEFTSEVAAGTSPEEEDGAKLRRTHTRKLSRDSTSRLFFGAFRPVAVRMPRSQAALHGSPLARGYEEIAGPA